MNPTIRESSRRSGATIRGACVFALACVITTLIPAPIARAQPSQDAVVGWGYNYYGQTNVPTPNADFTGIVAGAFHSLGLKADGSIVGWGTNYVGEIDVPAPNTDFKGIAAGAVHSLAIRPVTGDTDGDGDVDWGDFATFVDYLLGPFVGPQLACWRFFDVDMDDDVDLRDLAVWQNAFTGP